MMRHGEAATLAATAIVSLAVGFGTASLLPTDARSSGPLIDPNAWAKTSPAPATIQPVRLAPPAPRCSDWAISDVAMEEVLDEMIRRGWRPPTQGEAIVAMDVAGITAQDPNAPMPYRAIWVAPDSTVNGDIIIEGEQSTDPSAEDKPAEAEKPVPPPA